MDYADFYCCWGPLLFSCLHETFERSTASVHFILSIRVLPPPVSISSIQVPTSFNYISKNTLEKLEINSQLFTIAYSSLNFSKCKTKDIRPKQRHKEKNVYLSNPLYELSMCM